MFKFLLIILSVFCLFQSDAKAEPDLTNLQVIASSYEPYSYLENGVAQGEAVNQAHKIFAELNYHPDIKIYPWPRAYKTALNIPNTVIFSMARTPEREDLFHWIGEIVNYNVYLYKDKRRKDIQIDHLAQAAPYRIGGIDEDVRGLYLAKKGLKTVHLTIASTAVMMLLNQRIDLLPKDVGSMKHSLKKLHLAPDA